jgi:hypothetical protein
VRPRAYALTEKAIRYLDTFGHTYDTSRPSPRARREKPVTAPGRPLPKGLCPVCGNRETVLLDGGMGLHSRGSHDSGWCRGYGRLPMRVVQGR